MLILYLLIVTVAILILGSAAPLVQYLILRMRSKKKNSFEYIFPKELFDYDMDSNNCADKNNCSLIPRTVLATRGWVRGTQGVIMTQESFEEKKNHEYKIDLP